MLLFFFFVSVFVLFRSFRSACKSRPRGDIVSWPDSQPALCLRWSHWGTAFNGKIYNPMMHLCFPLVSIWLPLCTTILSQLQTRFVVWNSNKNVCVIPKLELIVLTWHNTIQWNWDCSYNLLLHLKPAGIRLKVDLIFNSNYDNFPVNKVVIYSLIWFCGSVKLCLRWKKQFSSIKLTKKNQNIALCALFICHIVP